MLKNASTDGATKAMVDAGLEALREWEASDDYRKDDCVRQIFAAMVAKAATPDSFVSEHHLREVRKHWDYLVNKYVDMPFRSDTSSEVANVTNDAINLANGIRRYG